MTWPVLGLSALLWLQPLLATPLDDQAELVLVAKMLMLQPGTAVADVGAGAGAWTARMARYVGPRGKVYATEIKPDLLRHLSALAAAPDFQHVQVVTARDDEPGLPRRCCDAVLMRYVYHALKAPAASMTRLHESLKTNGRVLIVDFRPGVDQLTVEMRDAGFELLDVSTPWAGKETTYGALFVQRGRD